MSTGIRAEGVQKTMIALEHSAKKVADTARKHMHRGSDRIVKSAKLYAPVDDYNLEKSIRKLRSYGASGRLQIAVVMGGVVNGVDVERYAMEIHENYSSYKPGAGTQAKRAANPGVLIGEKFLTRAEEDNRAYFEEKMTEIITKAIDEVNLDLK